MVLSIRIWLALFCLDCVDCLTCLHCTDTQNPRHCKHVTECPAGEICHIHQKTTKYGEVLFDLGCTEISTCSNRSQGNHSCDECCGTNLCNSAGCGKPGYPSGRGPICYSCSDQSTEGSSCHSIEFCATNEVCMISDEREFGDTVYTSQCAVLAHCENHKIEVASIIGRSLSDNTRALTETTCHKCCHADLCNAYCSNELDRYGQDCLELKNLTHVSGVYRVRPAGMIKDIEVYCDMATDGGGWTVFQRRVDGSVDFVQNSSSYENGFGDVHGEHWLGLKYIYAMTNKTQSELRIDLMAGDGSTSYEVFPNFRLSAAPNYTLHIDPGHGTAGDTDYGLSTSNGHRFVTYEQCYRSTHGGWWLNVCGYYVNLNGQYGTQAGVVYHDFKGWASLNETRMMFRRV